MPVYRRGQTVRGQQINLKYSVRRNGSSYRAAVVVSKKVHKSAVVRNRIRRRIFELIRINQASLPPVDIVITVFIDQIVGLPAKQLQDQIKELLSRINVAT